METDAFDEAIGRCLLQTNDVGVICAVAFYSCKLAKAERNYEIYNKEMLAIVACLTEWRVYLEGVPGRGSTPNGGLYKPPQPHIF